MKRSFLKLCMSLLVGTWFLLIPSHIFAVDDCNDHGLDSADGFSIKILSDDNEVNGSIPPGQHDIKIRVTPKIPTDKIDQGITSRTLLNDQGYVAIKFSEPGWSGDCSNTLENNPFALFALDENTWTTESLSIDLRAGENCDIHLVDDRGESICDFNGIDETGDLVTADEGGDSDIPDESVIIVDGGASLKVFKAELCNYGNGSADCVVCLNSGGVYTGIGCVPVGNMSSFIVALLNYAVGIGGGITFLMIIAGGFVILTSSGNPEKLQTGKEIITNAIAGLLLIIFSAVILRIIGEDILQIPGFGIR